MAEGDYKGLHDNAVWTDLLLLWGQTLLAESLQSLPKLCQFMDSLFVASLLLRLPAPCEINSHSIKFAILKYKSQWLRSCIIIATVQFQASFITPKRNLVPMLSPHSVLLSSLSSRNLFSPCGFACSDHCVSVESYMTLSH